MANGPCNTSSRRNKSFPLHDAIRYYPKVEYDIQTYNKSKKLSNK